MRLGIEASNLRRGGGITHLREILRAADGSGFGFSSVVVWSGRTTLDALPQASSSLRLQHEPSLDRGLLARSWWQRFGVEAAARREGCDLLFVPGGSYLGTFRPFVTMSRNMLPFEPEERARYGLSPMRAKLTLLERVQSASMRRADGVIFLNGYARRRVEARAGVLAGRTAVIPHGVDDAFRIEPRPQQPLDAFTAERPFRLLYVSIIDVYKHQDNVAAAVSRLRERGLPVTVDFRGPRYAPAARRLRAVTGRLDPRGEAVHVGGAVPYGELPATYAAFDGFVFASSCENMPNILLEAMAAGLPIASSNRGPMPEILGDAGIFFDPENVDELAAALATLVTDRDGRARWAAASYRRAAAFSWKRCAEQTYSFLAEVAAARMGNG